jgi:hypothetical protein
MMNGAHPALAGPLWSARRKSMNVQMTTNPTPQA